MVPDGRGQVKPDVGRGPRAPTRPIGEYLGHEPIATGALSPEVSAVTWEAPDFSEVKMNAGINSDQDDLDRERDDRF